MGISNKLQEQIDNITQNIHTAETYDDAVKSINIHMDIQYKIKDLDRCMEYINILDELCQHMYNTEKVEIRDLVTIYVLREVIQEFVEKCPIKNKIIDNFSGVMLELLFLCESNFINVEVCI